jgi:hypothetical protein
MLGSESFRYILAGALAQFKGCCRLSCVLGPLPLPWDGGMANKSDFPSGIASGTDLHTFAPRSGESARRSGPTIKTGVPTKTRVPARHEAF